MYDFAFNLATQGAGATDEILFINRFVLGVFFAISGYHKLFNSARHAGLIATLRACHIPCIAVTQWFVPSVEFLGGIALLFGILAPLVSVGLFVICFVAYCTDGYKRVRAYAPIDKADYLDDVLYIPEVLYGLGLLVVIFAGPGALRLL